MNDWGVDSLSGHVILGFSTGFSGVELSLMPEGDSVLVGEAREFWDFPSMAAHVPARAFRAPCTNELAGKLER